MTRDRTGGDHTIRQPAVTEPGRALALAHDRPRSLRHWCFTATGPELSDLGLEAADTFLHLAKLLLGLFHPLVRLLHPLPSFLHPLLHGPPHLLRDFGTPWRLEPLGAFAGAAVRAVTWCVDAEPLLDATEPRDDLVELPERMVVHRCRTMHRPHAITRPTPHATRMTGESTVVPGTLGMAAMMTLMVAMMPAMFRLPTPMLTVMAGTTVVIVVAVFGEECDDAHPGRNGLLHGLRDRAGGRCCCHS